LRSLRETFYKNYIGIIWICGSMLVYFGWKFIVIFVMSE
jgi:hypothetical protein